MVEVKYNREHHAGATPEARIANRLKTSAEPQRGSGAQVTTGSGPNRTVTTVHHSANTRQHGGVNRGEPGIDGKPRGPAK
jgi:hypothetical protein